MYVVEFVLLIGRMLFHFPEFTWTVVYTLSYFELTSLNTVSLKDEREITFPLDMANLFEISLNERDW